nr:hypothetical protein [Candidatus Freyrarchaeum guaymaensis]
MVALSDYGNYYEGYEEEVPVGLITSFIGVPASLIWIGWTYFYLRYLEGYSFTMSLLAASSPYLYPYVEASTYLSIYLVAQIMAYTWAKELLGFIWYSSMVVAAIIFVILDAVLIMVSRGIERKRRMAASLGVLGLIVIIPFFFGPQIAIYALALRLAIHVISAIILR